jgi:S1-C subfamily serine protease
MSRMRGIFRSPFGSALVGGAVVALFGWIAIAAGWVDAEGGDSTTTTTTAVAAPLPSPILDEESGGGNTINEIYRRDGQGVAFVEAGQATGSGFVIDAGGHLITNSHVVEGATDIEVKLGSSETRHSAEVVGTDPATDVALLKVDAPADELRPLALGDSSGLRVGDPVVAIGNPFGLDRTVTSGIVSALQRHIEAPNGFSISHVIQTDAAINPGNSGGPLIDTSGRVIGINAQIQSGTGGNVGIGFAIPINTAREVVRQLEEDGTVEHAFFGITGTSITAEIARAVNLPVNKGVLVQEVAAGGPAEDAGLRGGTTSATIEGAEFRLGGDIITEMDGKPTASMEDVIDVINGANPGDKLEVTILRGGDTKEVTVMLGERPASARPR